MILFLYVPRAFNSGQLPPPGTSHLRELFMWSWFSDPLRSRVPPFGIHPSHGHAIDNLHKCWPLITTANSSHNLFWPATVCITTHITTTRVRRPFYISAHMCMKKEAASTKRRRRQLQFVQLQWKTCPGIGHRRGRRKLAETHARRAEDEQDSGSLWITPQSLALNMGEYGEQITPTQV